MFKNNDKIPIPLPAFLRATNPYIHDQIYEAANKISLTAVKEITPEVFSIKPKDYGGIDLRNIQITYVRLKDTHLTFYL